MYYYSIVNTLFVVIIGLDYTERIYSFTQKKKKKTLVCKLTSFTLRVSWANKVLQKSAKVLSQLKNFSSQDFFICGFQY